jgi:3-oxoacyl-[acyl-carrier-protein] synthase II
MHAAVTGLGLVTPLGTSLESTLAAIASGACAARRPTLFDPSGFNGTLAAEIPHLDARPWFRAPKALKLTDRQTRLAVIAATQAAGCAGWTDGDADDLGVVIGTSGADLRFDEIAHALVDTDPDAAEDPVAFGRAMLDGLTPLWGLTVLPNMPSAHVAIQLGARGPNSTVMTGWAAGLQAIAEAALWIHAGEASRVLAGGADTSVQRFAFGCLNQAGMLSEDGGFLPGEGAGVLAIESPASARSRGAPVAGWIVGAASGAGAIEDFEETLVRTIQSTLAAAGWTPASVDLIDNAGGGIPGSGALVSAALDRVFQGRAGASVRHSSEAGHALGAAGAIASVLALASDHWTRALIISCDPSGVAAVLALGREDEEALRA